MKLQENEQKTIWKIFSTLPTVSAKTARMKKYPLKLEKKEDFTAMDQYALLIVIFGSTFFFIIHVILFVQVHKVCLFTR